VCYNKRNKEIRHGTSAAHPNQKVKQTYSNCYITFTHKEDYEKVSLKSINKKQTYSSCYITFTHKEDYEKVSLKSINNPVAAVEL